MDMGSDQGCQRGGARLHGKRRHTQARGAGTSGGDWQVVGAGDIHMGGALQLEKSLGAGGKLEGFNDEWLRMGRR